MTEYHGPKHLQQRSGFTLAEMLVSLTVMGVIMTGLGSAIVLTSRALPAPDDVLLLTINSRDALDQIATDLYAAIAFSERTATAVTFTVADRNDDAAPETIRYAWSGTKGAPLTRRINGGSVVNVADDVQEFDLVFLTRAVTRTESTTTNVNSGEIELASFLTWPGITPALQNVGVDSANWTAEVFSFSGLPADATNLTISRVLLKMRQGLMGTAGSFSVAIHPAVGGGNSEPQNFVLGTPTLQAGSYLPLSTYDWREYLFSDVTRINSSKEYVLVVKGTNATWTDAEVLRYYNRNAPKDTTKALWTDDGGGSWDPRSNTRDDYDFPFYVYGSYDTTTTVDAVVSRYFLNSIMLSLRVGADMTARIETGVQVLNEPEVSGP